MTHQYDVVVIGAGPAGSVCAALLAQGGLRVLVLEEHAAAGDFVNCTGIIGMEAFELLDLPREPILATMRSLLFVMPSGRRFPYRPETPLAQVVSRKAFDSALAEQAAAAGAEFRFGTRVRTLSVVTDGVTIGFGPDEPPRTAQAVVIATGFGTNLPQQAGLKGVPAIIYGAQAEVPMDGLAEGVTEIYLGKVVAPNSFAWVVPIGPDVARVGMTVSQHAPYHFEAFMRSAHLAPRLRTGRWTMKLSPVPLGMMPKSYTDRVLVVGEAAGQVKTTTQGGIYYGMLCAGLAAKTLRMAWARRDWSAIVLRAYEREWHQKLSPELKIGEYLRSLLARLTDEQLETVIELGTHGEVAGLIRRIARFDWHRDVILSSLRMPILRELARLVRA